MISVPETELDPPETSDSRIAGPYNPEVVWGAPVYAYPPIYYPPPGYYAAGMAISFGIGVAIGAAWGGGWGGWGYHPSWGSYNSININNNNNFINNSNRQNINRPSQQPSRAGNSNWQHNPQHRGGTPYPNRDTANRFGGSARGDSLANRQATARQSQDRVGGMQKAGVETFIVSHDGIVYQKDLGPDTLKVFGEMERYNPDKTWARTYDDWPSNMKLASASE